MSTSSSSLPSPYSLSSRRSPGQRPVEVVPHSPNWAAFVDDQTKLLYYMSRENGECTFARPADPAAAVEGPFVAGPVDPASPLPVNPPPSSSSSPPSSLPSDTEAHFAKALATRGCGGSGAVIAPPPEEDYPGEGEGRPPFSEASKGSSSSSSSSSYSSSIRDVDMNLFKACRDSNVQHVLDHLIGKTAPFFDSALFSDVNVNYHAKRDGSGWDVVPSLPPLEEKATSFFWPAAASPKGGPPLPPASLATDGDTLLHIALKVKRKDLVRWLSESGDLLDLNRVNKEGATAKATADRLGVQNMYAYFFVLE